MEKGKSKHVWAKGSNDLVSISFADPIPLDIALPHCQNKAFVVFNVKMRALNVHEDLFFFFFLHVGAKASQYTIFQ